MAIENPLVQTDCGGPPGELPCHIHRSCPKQGVDFQCPHCKAITRHKWKDIDQCNGHLEDEESHVIMLPACPGCGAIAGFNHNDVYYGQELPHYHTMRSIREHFCARPRFQNLQRFQASKLDGRYQGTDFTNLDDAHQQRIVEARDAAQ
jgi:hypothetical protein